MRVSRHPCLHQLFEGGKLALIYIFLVLSMPYIGLTPNIIVRAIVADPDRHDGFKDVRKNYNYTEQMLVWLQH